MHAPSPRSSNAALALAPLNRMRFFLAAAFLLLVTATPTLAADVCCLCKGANDAQPTCLTAPQESTQVFDPVSRTFSTVRTSEACGSVWAVNNGLDGWTCTTSISASGCVPSSQENSQCPVGPIPAKDAPAQKTPGEAIATVGADENTRPPAIIPNLNTPIPGLTFTGGEGTTEETSSLLAQYIAATYRYGISITAVAATVMFVWGAFMYLIGSAITSVQRGKTIMQEAILGMILVFGAHMILRTVNPNTLTLEALHIQGIRPDKALSYISHGAYTQITGQPVMSKSDVMALARQKAAETGIDEMPCIIHASMSFESGGAVNVVGHDENSRRTDANITSRRRFLESGLKYSGERFEPITCPGSNTCLAQGPDNDDARYADLSNPPNYGLDWRFSHGFGASQATIFPDSLPCEGKENLGRGFRRGGRCYTIPELLTAEGTIDAMINYYTECWNRTKDPAASIACYGGHKNVNSEATQKRMEVYNRCRSQRN